MTQIDKKKLFDIIIEKLEGNLKVLVESAFEAKEASTNEESKAENKYDTRGLEASYLASGQAKRAQDLQEQIFQLKKVSLREFTSEDAINISAVICLQVNEQDTKIIFLIPVGGVEVIFDNQNIQTITLEAPLGRALHGLYEGDDFEMNGNNYEILRVE